MNWQGLCVVIAKHRHQSVQVLRDKNQREIMPREDAVQLASEVSREFGWLCIVLRVSDVYDGLAPRSSS